MQKINYENDEIMRLDTYLASTMPSTSRSQLKKHIENGEILVNDKIVKAGFMLNKNDVITIEEFKPQEMSLEPQNIPLDVVYENEDYAVINKPQGMVVHPAVGNYDGTLVNALLYRMKSLSQINGEYRPGIVHRLDKDTSGLIVIAKNDIAHRELARQIESKECKRYYLALVEGCIKDGGIIETNLIRSPNDRKKYTTCNEDKGKHAVTIYKVLKTFKDYTLLECELKTGRTHQIRVHCQYIHHPIVGDPVYGIKKQKIKTNGQLLHAYKLVLTDPKTKQRKEFECKLPPYFEEILSKLK